MGTITVILAWWVAEKLDKIKLVGYSGSRAQSILVLTGKELVRPANGSQLLSSIHLCLGGTSEILGRDKGKVLSGSSGHRAFLGFLQGKQPLDYPGPALTTAQPLLFRLLYPSAHQRGVGGWCCQGQSQSNRYSLARRPRGTPSFQHHPYLSPAHSSTPGC